MLHLPSLAYKRNQDDFFQMMISIGKYISVLITVDFYLRLDIHEYSHMSKVLKCTCDYLEQYDLV